MARERKHPRRTRRRGRFRFFYKLISLVAVVAAIVTACVIFFRVNEVKVEGNSHYTAQEIIDASGVAQGDNLFLVGSSRTAQKIYSTLPYVDEVNIRHALPDGIVITVTERVPAAVIQGDDGWWIIDAKGKILDGVSRPEQAGVAEVTGLTALLPAVGTTLAVEDADSLKLESLLSLLKALSQRDMITKISTIDLSSAAEVSMFYDGRLTVKMKLLGAAEFSEQVRDFAAILEQGIVQDNERGTLDMTLNTPHFIPRYGEN